MPATQSAKSSNIPSTELIMGAHLVLLLSCADGSSKRQSVSIPVGSSFTLEYHAGTNELKINSQRIVQLEMPSGSDEFSSTASTTALQRLSRGFRNPPSPSTLTRDYFNSKPGTFRTSFLWKVLSSRLTTREIFNSLLTRFRPP